MNDLTPMFTAWAVAAAGVIVPLVQYLTQRKLGLSPAQEKLIALLDKTIDAQGSRINWLEQQLSDMRQENLQIRQENMELRRTIAELRSTVSDQAVELAKRVRPKATTIITTQEAPTENE